MYVVYMHCVNGTHAKLLVGEMQFILKFRVFWDVALSVFPSSGRDDGGSMHL
jgi:hypothetical protein